MCGKVHISGCVNTVPQAHKYVHQLKVYRYVHMFTLILDGFGFLPFMKVEIMKQGVDILQMDCKSNK